MLSPKGNYYFLICAYEDGTKTPKSVFWMSAVTTSFSLWVRLCLPRASPFGGLFLGFFFFGCCCLFRATPTAYRGSQTRGTIAAVAAGPQPQQCQILNPLIEARD